MTLPPKNNSFFLPFHAFLERQRKVIEKKFYYGKKLDVSEKPNVVII